MTNSDNGSILQEIVNSVAKVYGFTGLLFTIIKTIVKVSDLTEKSHVGKYKVKSYFVMIFQKDNQLNCEFADQRKSVLFTESDNKFFSKTLSFKIEFMKDGSGQVTSAILNFHGQKAEAKKL